MILFFDTETTGIRKDGFLPRVVQIGALMTNDEGKTLHELNFLLQPEDIIMMPQAAAVHGFTIELLKQAGVSRDVALTSFFELVDLADTLVAHNIVFDLDLMNIEIACQDDDATSVMWKTALDATQQFCTMENSREICKVPLTDKQLAYFHSVGRNTVGEYKNPHLQEAYKHFFHKEFEGAHDAMADVRACRDVYFALHSLKAA